MIKNKEDCENFLKNKKYLKQIKEEE